MEITDIETIPVEVEAKPLEDPHGIAPYVNGYFETQSSTTSILIRLETDDGVVGWGETHAEPSVDSVRSIVHDKLEPALIGKDVCEIEPFIEDVRLHYMELNDYIGGVEMAMWDAFGKILDVPLYQLLGGKLVEEIPVAYCLGILDPEESRTYARRAVTEGFEVLKTKGGPDWKEATERIIAMDDEVDGDLEFRVDPNQMWSVQDTVRAAARLEDRGIYLQYLEQPIRVHNPGALHTLRSRVKTPIAVNEDLYTPNNFSQLVAADAIDVGVIDLIPAGGILGLRRMTGVAADFDIPLAHHSGFDLGVKSAAIQHVVASTPELDLSPDSVYYALKDDVLAERLRFEEGAIEVPDGPGLGVTVSESKLDEHRIDRSD